MVIIVDRERERERARERDRPGGERGEREIDVGTAD